MLGNKAGQLGHAFGLVEYTAQIGLEYHVRQTLVAGFQRLFLVLLEEELGVGQARAHHLLVTGDDLRRVLALQVGDGDKARQQLAVGIQQAEVLLVILHGRDQRFLRHLKEAFLEAAHQRHRPFDQRGDFVQQVRRHDGGALLLCSQRVDAALDDLAALGEIGDHVRAAQGLGISRRTGDGDLIRVVEAVAAGQVTGTLRENLAGHDLITQQHDQPLGRADEFGLAGTPAHALGNRQRGQCGVNDAGQQIGGRLARDVLYEAQLRTTLVDLGQADTALAGKAFGGFGRVAVGVKRRLYGRAIELGGAVGLLGCQRLDQHGQAARRGVVAGLGVAQTGVFQTSFNPGQEGFGQLLQGLGRQLFGAQFNEKILRLHYSASFSLASTSSRNSGVAIGKPRRARASR